MAQENVLNIAKEYAAAVRKILNANSIFLYGPHAKETATQDSDVDIAAVVDKIPGDYLDTMPMLWKLTRFVDYDIGPVLLTASDDERGF